MAELGGSAGGIPAEGDAVLSAASGGSDQNEARLYLAVLSRAVIELSQRMASFQLVVSLVIGLPPSEAAISDTPPRT
jgi:hypothetical protein